MVPRKPSFLLSGNVIDTSQTYLLFQTLLILFWAHSCMIWTKLTRTDAVFSRAAVWFICVQENGFLSISEKSTKNQRRSTHPKEPNTRSGARGGPGGAQAPCWRPPLGRTGGSPGWGPHPLVPYFTSYFYSRRKNPRSEVLSQFSVAEPPPPSVLPREG